MSLNETLELMIKNGEFDKIINNKKVYKWQDREKTKEWYELIKDNKDLDKIPPMALILSCKSVPVLQDLIIYLLADIKAHDDESRN